MNEAEAIAIATRARLEFKVSEQFKLVSTKCKIIELVVSAAQSVDELPEPGPSRDIIAWLVTFGESAMGVELAIDDNTGEIVRVQQTAGATAIQTQMETEL